MIHLEPRFAIEGVEVGHWSDQEGMTGCTAVVLPEGAVASGEVRGGAPASREFELLHLGRTVSKVDAVVLCGGSAFGLSAADGVVDELAARGRGLEVRVGRVPIVVALALFDLAEGDANVHPGPGEGRAAVRSATGDPVEPGRHGAGTGCTAAKWAGDELRRPAGLGVASATDGTATVAVLVAANPVGDLPERAWPDLADKGIRVPAVDKVEGESTTIGVIVTDAVLDKTGCHLVAQSGHDGLARALVPAHTTGDGDALVAVSLGAVEHGLEQVRMLAALAVTAAIRTALGDEDPASTLIGDLAGE